jgi:hypothetical protein
MKYIVPPEVSLGLYPDDPYEIRGYYPRNWVAEFTVVDVSTTVKEVLPPNPRRYQIHFTNHSGGEIYISTNPDLQQKYGIPLLQHGTNFALDIWKHRTLTMSRWFAIATASCQLLIFSVIEVT